jgi:hypothetical protein
MMIKIFQGFIKKNKKILIIRDLIGSHNQNPTKSYIKVNKYIYKSKYY